MNNLTAKERLLFRNQQQAQLRESVLEKGSVYLQSPNELNLCWCGFCFPQLKSRKVIFPCSWDRNGIRWISLLQELFGQNAGKSSYDLNFVNSQVLLFYVLGKRGIINNKICQMLLLYGTYDSWIYASRSYSLTPISRTNPAQQQEPCPWVHIIVSCHSSQARALSTLQDWLVYFSPCQQNPRVLERANKQNKTKQKPTRRKPSICWKCWATFAPILLIRPWNFLPVLLCKCQKTMVLFLQILRDIFFGFAPYASSFLMPYVSEHGFKRTCPGNISFTYSWELTLYQILRVRWI